MERTKYVVGFLFDDDSMRVALILKTHPEMQKGKYNGVGGVVLDGESPINAMRREFLEEAGVGQAYWELYHVEPREDHIIYFYRAMSSDSLSMVTTMTEEVISIHYRHMIPLNALPDLDNMVKLAVVNPTIPEQ